ncbi:MAG: hypothetical protein ACUVX1_17045 [Chloroflexota bacterium]
MAEQRKQVGDDFLTEMLRGTKTTRVEIQMLEETYQKAVRLAAENGWSEEEALLTIFVNGLGYTTGELESARVAQGQSELAESLAAMTERYMKVESMYAVLKFRAYYLAEDRRILELSANALRRDNEGMSRRLMEYRSEVEALKLQIERLELENRELRANAATPSEAVGQDCADPAISFRSRLGRVLRRR